MQMGSEPLDASTSCVNIYVPSNKYLSSLRVTLSDTGVLFIACSAANCRALFLDLILPSRKLVQLERSKLIDI